MRAALGVALMVVCAAASAQTIYKCKGADGRYSYSNQPCAGDGGALGKASASQQKPGAPKDAAASEQPPAARGALPKQCDNSAMLKAVVGRLDSARTPDDVRAFLAEERLRLLRCEYMRFTPDEMRAREAAMAETAAADAARRRAGVQRVEALYERYLTPADRAARSQR